MTLYDKEKGRLQKIADEGEKQPSKHPISSSIFEQDRPKEASWYIKMMVARLLWPKCEDRETVIKLFKIQWPDHRIADRAEEFYDEAVKIIQA